MSAKSVPELLAERDRIDAEVQAHVDRATKVFGRNVRVLREERDWTQGDLADRIGLSRPSIANMEAGKQATPWPTLCLLADVFGVPLDRFRDEPNETTGKERNA
jgi:putative transcriptional regulator